MPTFYTWFQYYANFELYVASSKQLYIPPCLIILPLVISGDWQKYAANIIKPAQTGINRNKYTFCTKKSLEPL